MLHKDYDRKGSGERKISDRESQGAWRQDELIGGKPPVVKSQSVSLESRTEVFSFFNSRRTKKCSKIVKHTISF
jgi:hypothetical protein